MRTHLTHFTAAALLLTAPALTAAPIITEFLASNQTGILDEDLARPDWIEIYNPDGVQVDLGGYHLTDDILLPARWTFPAGTLLNPGSYLVVFASNKDRAVAGQPLHTNFQLSAGGEYLALNAPGGTPHLSEWNLFPVQTADVSYGLLAPTTGAASAYFTTPTPGAPNSSVNAPAEAVVFTPPSKTFNSGTTLNVALGVTSPTATVRYTTNRSYPIGVAGITGNFTADAATDICTMTAHGLTNGDMVRVSGPTPLITTMNYFVTVLSADTFKLTIEPLGPPIDLTAGGSQTIRRDAYTATAATTDTFTTPVANSFRDGDPVQVSSTGTLPAPVTAGTTYYLVSSSTTTFRLSTSPTLAPILDITTAGTGVHTVFRTPSPVYSSVIPVTINTRVRARAFEPGRPAGPVIGEMYYALDAAAQTLTSPLPLVVSHTWNTGMADNTAVEAHVMIFEPQAPDNLTRLTNLPTLAAPCTLERRGSSTAGDPKYSMAIEMQDENGIDRNLSPLGMPAESDWVMHAPYHFDRSMMHNDLIYRLSNDIGRYAVRTKFVEHIHNTQTATNTIEGAITAGSGDYFGVYSFMEKITRGNNRVDVENLTIDPADSVAPAVQGGYMFKVDRRDPGEGLLVPLAGQSFGPVNEMSFVNPREVSNDPFKRITTAQSNYLRDYIGDAWAVLNGPNFMDPVTGYNAFFDVPAVVDHQLLNIMTKNADANRLSAYWHKPRFGKMTAGPIWDFDRAEGSTDGRDFNWGTWRGDSLPDAGTDFFHYPWYNEMFRDPNFWQMFIDRYHQWRQGAWSTASVHARIDELAAQLNPGDAAGTPAKRTVTRWAASAPRAAGSNTAITNNSFNGQFTGEIAWIKHWWASRLNFMDNQFTRPATTNLPSGPVPASSSITLTSPSLATSGVKIYYTTDGTDPRPQATAPLPPSGGYVTIATLLPEISRVYTIIPTSAATGGAANEWRGADLNANNNNVDDFNHSTWFTNAPGQINGVGYDNTFAVGAVDYQPLFSVRWNTSAYYNGGPTAHAPTAVSPISTSSVMMNQTISGTAYAGNQTCYIRIPFTLTPAQLALITPTNRLVLQMHHDDGFAAWINGTELPTARLNAPATASLVFNSAAATTTADATAITYIDYDISAQMAALHAGENVLAIHGLNSGLASSDFLIGAQIVIQSPPPPFMPDLSPSAIEYTGALNITAPTQLFVRTVNPIRPSDPPTQINGGIGSVPNGSSWSAPTLLYYFPGASVASQANIKITEVFYHPSPPTAAEITAGFLNSNDFEFIRLTNTGAAPVDLTGIYFSNGLTFTAVPGLQNWLPAGASVVVVENSAAFTSRYGSSFTILGEFSGELDDGGEHIVLNDKTGAIISDFIYGDGNGAGDAWPTAPDDGYSLIYVSGDQNLPASWRVSLDPGGSGATTFARWQSRYFAAADIPAQTMAADLDGDGLNNLGEYAFGTDPRTAGTAEHLIGLAVSGQPGRLTFRRRTGTTDLTWVVETTADLTSPSWSPVAAPPVSTVSDGCTESLTYDAPGAPAGARLFIRARVTSP